MIANKNIQIVFVISTIFFAVFSCLFLLQSVIPVPNANIAESAFFKQNFDDNIKKIFILGSSQTATLNTAHIIQKVVQTHNDYTVYNLSYDNDNPKKRLDSLQEIINLKPTIVFYGVSFRDFTPEIKIDDAFLISQIKNNFELDISVNPKLITVTAMKNFLGDIDLKNTHKINQINTPFTEFGQRRSIIVDENELKKESMKSAMELIDFNDNEKLNDLKEIISNLKKNDIQVILFAVPLPKIHLNLISDSEREEFHTVLNNVAKDFDIEFYDFTEKYENLSIWSDFSHVALNPQTIIYSEDVARIILSEITQ